jgi:hypothetical protein
MLNPISLCVTVFALLAPQHLQTAPKSLQTQQTTAQHATHCTYNHGSTAHRAFDFFELPANEAVWFWSPERLTWQDYQGEANYHLEDVAALTSSGIVSWKGCKNGKIDFEIRAYLDKKESWVKPEAYTSYHLSHEQGHFDITEIYARRLDVALKERAFDCGEEEEFEEFINLFLEDWQRTQKQYDLDSGFSTYPTQQAIWLEKIRNEIARNTIYAHTNPFE